VEGGRLSCDPGRCPRNWSWHPTGEKPVPVTWRVPFSNARDPGRPLNPGSVRRSFGQAFAWPTSVHSRRCRAMIELDPHYCGCNPAPRSADATGTRTLQRGWTGEIVRRKANVPDEGQGVTQCCPGRTRKKSRMAATRSATQRPPFDERPSSSRAKQGRALASAGLARSKLSQRSFPVDRQGKRST
jgi:hypothetical protein